MNGVTRRWIAIGVVLVAVGRLPSDAAAQTTGSAIEALVARALAEAPALEAARAQVRVAEGQRQQAALRPNPIAAVVAITSPIARMRTGRRTRRISR